MKKEYLMFAFIATAMLTACSGNDDAINIGTNENWNGEIKLRSNIATTRATFGQNTQVLPNQTLYLWVDDTNEPNKISGIAGTAYRELYNCVHMTSDGNGGFTNFSEDVYYPVTGNSVNLYSLNANPDSSNAMNLGYAACFARGGDFPTYFVQKTDSLQNTAMRYAKNDLLLASNIQKARNHMAANLTYKHLLSQIVVVANSSFTIKDCRIIGVKRLGAVSITRKRLEAPVVNISAAPNDVGNIIMGTTNDSIEAVIIPQTIEANKAFLQFTVQDGGTFTYQLPATKNFESGHKYRFEIKFEQTEPVIQTSVMNWTTNGTLNWE